MARLDKSRVAAVVDTRFGREMLLEGDRAQAGNPEKEQVWSLLVEEIEPDPEQPRRHFDVAALQELSDDIGRRGVLQPLVVRRLPGEPARYRIIVGERRWRAAKMAGKPRIPCLIREMDSESVRQAQLVENVVREGLSDVERGMALRALYEEVKRADPKATWEDVARRVGLKRVQIHLLSRLSHLPQEIIDLINTGRLSGSHGVELGRLNGHRERQFAFADEAARPDTGGAYKLSVTALRRRINATLQEDHGIGLRRRSTLTPQKLIERADDIAANLRPNLPPEVRQRLQRTADEILRYLEQNPTVFSQLNKGDVDTQDVHGEQQPTNDTTPSGDGAPQPPVFSQLNTSASEVPEKQPNKTKQDGKAV